jgi:hypothetical protein
MQTAYELFHKTHPDQAATDRRGTFPTLADAMAATGYQHTWEVGDQSWRVTVEARDHWLILAEPVAENDAERVQLALDTFRRFGQCDGESHHQTWLIDQAVRILAGDGYGAWVTEQRDGEDGLETYSWDEGIAP